MPNSRFDTAISQPRFARYLWACNNDRDKALMPYRANIALSQQMYGVLGVFEVILRNSIDRYFSSVKGDEWLARAVNEEGYLDISPGCEYSCHLVHEAIHKLGTQYTHDRLISKMSFGFWTYQFARHEYAAAGNMLMNIFINRPYGTKQKQIHQGLIKINDLRNRIAHHEPICFDRKANSISTEMVRKRYVLIIELLTWLGCDPDQILHRIDAVVDAINNIEAIKSSLKENIIQIEATS